MSDVINIILAKDPSKDESGLINALKGNFNAFGLFKVGEIQLARTRDEVTSLVETQRYQAVISKETINDELVGGGYIGKWMQVNPELTVVLMMSDDKYAQDKMFFLFEKGYYNAIYNKDFTDGSLVANLIKANRTKKEAIKYYGLEQNEKYKDAYVKNEMEIENNMNETDLSDNAPALDEDLGSIFGNAVNNSENKKSLGDFSYSGDGDEDEYISDSEIAQDIKSPSNVAKSESYVQMDNSYSMNEDYETFQQNANSGMSVMNDGNYYNNTRLGGLHNMDSNNNYNNMQFGNNEQYRPMSPNGFVNGNQRIVPEVKMNTQPTSARKTFSIEPYTGIVVAPVSSTAVIIEVPGIDFYNADEIVRGTQISLLIPTNK